jgi:Tfp pilus assembly protein PilV
MRTSTQIGYTLIEIVVALFLFAVGGLALVATSAVVGRELNASASRERAGRIAASKLEMLRAACHSASGGREEFGSIDSEWSVGSPDSSGVRLVESITYPTKRGTRTEVYRVTAPCPP